MNPNHDTPSRLQETPISDLKDPSIDLVRQPFLKDISRFCLLISLAQFLCIPPLFFLFSHENSNPLLQNYITAMTFTGLALMGIAWACKLSHLRKLLSYIAFFVLFGQSAYLYLKFGSISHPLVMLFPLLSFLSAPVLGRKGILPTSLLGSLTVAYLFFFQHPSTLTHDDAQWAMFLLIEFILTFAGYISTVLWKGVLERESKLRAALIDLQSKNREIETWVERLKKASSQINLGIQTEIPESPDALNFHQITENLEQIQIKMGNYFAQKLLEDRLSSIGVLASGMAHELNTPLTTLSLLISRHQSMSHDEKETLLGITRHMGSITQSILAFGSQTDFQRVDLNKTVQESKIYLETFKPSQVDVHIELAPLPLHFHAIDNEIQQVLLNLFKNAIDAVAHTGHPRIRISTSLGPAGYGQLIVEDNGAGMESHTIEKILEPFFTTKDPQEGSGLGLFVVHQILEKHQATINIQSGLHRGTRIVIHLPLDEAKTTQGAA